MSANTYTYYPSADGSGTAGRWESYGTTGTTVTILNGLSMSGVATTWPVTTDCYVDTATGLWRSRPDPMQECPT